MRGLLKKIFSPFLKKASAMYLKKRRKYSYKGISVWVEPTVFPPFITISTKILLDFINPLPLKNKAFLELGCGCGIISILAAKKEAIVTSTDINEAALRALKKNAEANGVNIEILFSDLFESLTGKSFDCIIINPPYYPKNPGSIAENAWFCGEDFEYFRKLFSTLPEFISAQNEIYMILSEDCDLEKIKAIALKNGMALNVVLEKKVAGEKNYIFRIIQL
ncbi:methyltransferase [Flavobacterium pallidum]|uniref:Methyltransferase n=1 Tax=Flavobacterium pallidum TaxID=2172098 RepID=A0A2S1SG91_9FLAO|nr:methyltransferase [Flavobacterium pallidum]AWI25357.1 methyltransferase [Flavobacterium pallidum]